MKAIILVAGEGKRIKPLTDNPKCLLKFAGTSILENALISLSREKFREVVLVVGYRAELIKEIGNSFNGMRLTYVYNPVYYRTNNMYSLYLARNHLSDGAVCFDGDIIFEHRVLEHVLKGKVDCWAGDYFKDLKGSVLTVNQLGRVLNVEIAHEGLTCQQSKYKSAAIIKISPRLGVKFASWLDEDVKMGDTQIYIDTVLGKRLDKHEIFICNLSGLKWAEIDCEEDYQRAKALFG